MSSLDRNVWVGVTQAGRIIRMDLDNESVEPLHQLTESPVDLVGDVSINLSAEGRMDALMNTRCRYGVVLDLELGRETMRLDRGDYHEEHCNFPVAFFEYQGRILLVHGTAWNRLDISDPMTGTLLTKRSLSPPQEGKGRPEHYLDYFHCGLTISPNQEYITDNGWVWHPVGIVATWNLSHWLSENVWESEDGPSKKSLCWRDYFWDGPLCWIDNHRLAIWGCGQDDEWLIPAVRIFDVLSGDEEKWFAGPKGSLVFDRYLFSIDKEEGGSVWDITTGERLLLERSFCPLRYHRGTKSFLTVLPDGAFRISRLRGRSIQPGWLSSNVVQIAQAIQQESAFDGLPILADALEEAGCADAEILSHCRQAMPHGKTCWVIDLLLCQDN